MNPRTEKHELFSQAFSENYFLLENIQGGIVYSDFNIPFHLRYATEGMSELSGYSQKELLAMEQMDLVCEADREFLLEEVKRQFSEGNRFAVEYRLKCKDGTFVYVLDRAKAVEHEDGKKYIHCLLTDITEQKLMEHALRLSQRKYKLAIEQSGNVIVEYNLKNKTIQFSENFLQVFGSNAPNGTLKELFEMGWVEVPYQEALRSMAKNVLKNKSTDSMELRIKLGVDEYLWCNLLLSAEMSANEDLDAMIGCLQNIDQQKKYVNNLKAQSEQDGLTNIYNRVTMEHIINDHLQIKNEGALIVLDIDNFKQVNDKNGHDFGDAVLIDLARKIESILPESAEFGRLGGDEFLIFIPSSLGNEDLKELGQFIVEQVQNAFKCKTVPITISLGLVNYGNRCKDFKALYKFADKALYEAKNNGRNGFVVYSETI